MKRAIRRLGPLVLLVGLAACAASSEDSRGVTSGQAPGTFTGACRGHGVACRWDGQCCSGRCYVDTGCSG